MTIKTPHLEPADNRSDTSKNGTVATFDADGMVDFFDDNNVAENIKTARQSKDLTLEQLSAMTRRIDPDGKGVSRVSLSRYENGDRRRSHQPYGAAHQSYRDLWEELNGSDYF